VDFSHPTFLQIFLTASLPIMGLAYALVGGLKLSLVDRLQIDEGKVGRLVGGFGTMFGPTILLCGFLTDAVGRKGVWLAGSVAVAASILILARTRTYRGALVAVVLLGIGWAAQVNVSNVLMRVAVPADRPREQLVWATNFFDFAFGFGAFVTPMVLALVLRRLERPPAAGDTRDHACGARCRRRDASATGGSAGAIRIRADRADDGRQRIGSTSLEPCFLGAWLRLPVFRATGDVHGRVGDDAGPSTNAARCARGSREAICRADAIGFLARVHR
jgi:MFS family permease